MDIEVVDSPGDAAVRAATWLVDQLSADLAARRGARVALSGGTTPALMFDALSAAPLDWAHVEVFQVDERLAPDGDRDRNATLLADRLRPSMPPMVHLMEVTDADLVAASSRYGQLVTAAPLDVVHLGLGDDGHTASWPPGDPVIDAPGAVAVSAAYQGRRRMTITPAVVNAARRRLFLVTGAGKADAVRRLVAGDPSLPASRVSAASTLLICDREAARQLGGGR
jgi:6-phosphogluconolactonase/glucosamine-6-phosphate isomerase/deaminase